MSSSAAVASRAFALLAPLAVANCAMAVLIDAWEVSIVGHAITIAAAALALLLWTKRGPESLRHRALELALGWHVRRVARPRRLFRHELSGATAEQRGFLPAEHDESLDAVADGQHVVWHCVDKDGGLISLRLALVDGRRAALWLVWKKQDGEWLTLARERCDYEDIEVAERDVIRVGGLTLSGLEPFRRARMTFAGMMKRSSDNSVVFVRMNYIWSVLNNPFEWLSDASPDCVARVSADIGVDDIRQLPKICRELLSGIDQFGALMGTSQIEEEDETEFYFRGLRRLDDTCNTEMSSLTGVSDCGHVFMFRFGDYKGQMFASGHISLAGGPERAFSEVEWPLAADAILRAWRNKTFKAHEFFIRAKAGKRWFNISVTVSPSGSEFVSHGGVRADGVVPVDVAVNCVRGRGVIHFASRDEAKQDQRLWHSVPLLKAEAKGEISEEELVVSLSSPACRDVSTAGGKGSSLALMRQCEDITALAEVPAGVCITTTAFRTQIRSSQALKEALSALDVLASDGDMSVEEKAVAMEKACQSCTEAIQSSSVDELVTKHLFKELESTFSQEKSWSQRRFAVRSSGVCEDSAELSAAGQNETVLGCRGQESILKAVVTCWASLYTRQSVEYRRQNGLSVVSDMAVVVQEMVDASAAGVVFSRDPVTGNPSRIFITANFGLGESVVSGSCDPDTVVVRHRCWLPRELKEQRFQVIEQNIGTKEKKIIMKSTEQGDGIEEVSVDQRALCLSESTCLRLAALAVELERHFGTPRDIEFAITEAGNVRLFLLQSRPITSLEMFTDWELQHEFDTAVDSERDISTKANVGEVLPGASSVLSATSIGKVAEINFQESFTYFMDPEQTGFCPYQTKKFLTASHHILMNYLDALLSMVESETVSPMMRAVDLTVFGHEVTTEKEVSLAIERRGIASKYYLLRRISVLIAYLARNAFWQRFGLTGLPKQETPISNSKSSAEALERFLNTVMKVYKIFGIHSQISSDSMMFELFMFTALAEGSPDWDHDLYMDAMDLIVSDDDTDVESAGVPHGLKVLSESISKCDTLSESFINESNLESAEALLNGSSSPPDVRHKYQEFVAKFYHRCLKELDLESSPWGENRRPLIETLKSMVEANKSKSHSVHKAEDRSTALEEKFKKLSKPIKDSTKRALRILAPLTIGGVAMRERTKSLLVRWCHDLRLAARCLAKALVAEQKLPDPHLVFHMSLYEVRKLTKEASPRIVQKALRRRFLHPQWNELRFPEMVRGVPKPLSSTPHKKSVSSVVRGTPVCRGVYVGRARVITRLQDAKAIQKGDVLITVSTDIGWSPYFPLLGSVVTELGGLISHGAVVAREFGLPCVVGAEGATDTFQTGDMVEVDGSKGTVSRVSYSDS